MKTTIRLYSLSYSDIRTYFFALVFIAGNIILPQLIHLIPNGGQTFLPVYFFTLIAAYKYGMKVGLLTAILSPLVNHFLFGMPAATVLPIILIKSSLLAVFTAWTANHSLRLSFLALIFSVLSYQLVGTGIEWIIEGSLYVALQDFRIGIPGMLLQIFGGYALLKAIAKI